MAAKYPCGVLLRQNGPVGCIAQWLATCARKPKVTNSSPTAGYAQRSAPCSNYSANVQVSVKRVEVVDRSHRNCLPLPLLSCISWMFGKENQNRKNGTLGESRYRGFLGFLVVDSICYLFLTLRQTAFGENNALIFCWETYSELWQGKPR